MKNIIPENQLSKVLDKISGILNVWVSVEDGNTVTIGGKTPLQMKNVKTLKGKDSATNDHSPSNGDAESDLELSGQKLLFPDDIGDNSTIKIKSKYRVRTPQRTSKKKPSEQLVGQGTLFETNCGVAKTA
jgi:hypothetical protein